MKLKELENTVVNTKTQEEFDELMGIYEKAGWVWMDGREPTKCIEHYTTHKEKTCVDGKNYFTYDDVDWHKMADYKIISLSKFKQLQGLEEKRKRGRPRKEQVGKITSINCIFNRGNYQIEATVFPNNKINIFRRDGRKEFIFEGSSMETIENFSQLFKDIVDFSNTTKEVLK